MASQLGSSVVISKWDETTSAYTTVSMGTASTLKFNNKLADITTTVNEEYISGILSTSFSFDGIFTDDKASVEFIQDLQNGVVQKLKVSFLSGFEVEANWLCESVDIKMAKKDAVSFSASFKSTGPVTLLNVPTA